MQVELHQQNIFGHQVQCNFNFEHVIENIKPVMLQDHSQRPVPSSFVSSRSVSNKLDISDTHRWQLANELIKHFDGIITEISGNKYD